VCGFAVSIDLDGRGRAAPWALALLRHRGPDGEGVIEEPHGNAVFEHCRLAIIDPGNPEADQPLLSADGRWVIVYNGEVFNFREIRAELERAGATLRTESDTEVVLLGFLYWGEGILERLQGMFAFVVRDRLSGDVFAARDQVGVKPFYYIVRDGLFLACSEVRPLLKHPRVRAAFDPAGVVEFLAFGDNPGERTLVEGVRKLLPGHCLRVRGGRVSVQEYWDVLPSGSYAGDGSHAPHELLAMVDDAVARALVSDVPLGLMLSGGIDSSIIAALAVRHVSASELTAYSVEFGLPDDEVAAAGRLARDLGINHRVIRVSADEIRDDFEQWLSDLDYPAGNPTWIASSFIARAAHEDGLKVLLSGDGGDELFGGYSRWMKYLRFHDFVWAHTPQAALRALGTASRPWLHGLARDIARRASSGNGLFVPSRPFHDDLIMKCLGTAGRAAADVFRPEQCIEDLRRRFDERLPSGDYLAWMSYVTLKTKLVEDFLQRLDKMGMRHSVEGRVPLLDPHLARWALGTPQKVKVPGYRQKALLRSAAESVLPAYVLQRPKQGFCPPVAAWCEELLRERPFADAGPLYEGRLLSPSGALDLRAPGGRHSFAFWTLGMLTEWSSRNLGSADVAALDELAA
jgi:asparagine synthase (glutamine-hydrolysing)